MEYPSFYDKTMLIFRVNNEGAPVKFGGKFYERYGSHLTEVTDETEPFQMQESYRYRI